MRGREIPLTDRQMVERDRAWLDMRAQLQAAVER